MKKYYLVFVLLFCCFATYSQELQLFGPRAGIGNLSDPGGSKMKEGFHSAFGWQIELPYTSGDITGYGEAGLYLLGIEQGKVFPHGWGYFGVRYKNWGIGAGPAINTIGVGIGFNTYLQIELEVVRIPIGVDFNFINKTTRIQLFVGFNYK